MTTHARTCTLDIMRVGGLLFAFVVCTVLGEAKKQKKLEIINEYVPEDCTSLAATGDTLIVHYTGKLQSGGKVFDSSRAPGREPFSVTLGAGSVIKGWDEGLIGMCVGELRRLIIPPHLAYGENGVPGTIPGGATLEFEIELLDLTKKPYFSMPQGNGFLTVLGILCIAMVVIYELYKRANKQGAELKDSKKREKKGGKNRRKRD